MNNLLLVLLGVMSVGSIIIGMSQENGMLKENFGAGGMPQLKAVGQRVIKPTMSMSSNGNNANSQVRETSIEYNPMSEVVSSQKNLRYSENQYSNNARPYSQQREMLGSYAVTDMPFVSRPGYQQSTPLTSPNIALPPMAKYKPTSLSNMGISPAYKNNCSNGGTLVENFSAPPNAAGYMGQAVDLSNMNPGPNYSAGNYAEVSMQKPCSGSMSNTSIPVGKTMEFSETGNPEQIQVYENLVYATVKPGRTCQNGVRDMIRGDLPVCPLPQMGWFNVPSKPTDLQTGSLQFMGGKSETVDSFQNFIQSYGATQNPYQPPAGQQTIPQMMNTLQTGNKALTAISFA